MSTGRRSKSNPRGAHWFGIYVAAMADLGQARPVSYRANDHRESAYRANDATLEHSAQPDRIETKPFI